MKILITGNMGYLGSVLASYLRRQYPDAELIGFDSGFFAHCLIGNAPLPEAALNAQYFGDIRDFLVTNLYQVDTVIHLAALSNDPMGNKFEAVTCEANQEASRELIDKAIIYGVKNFIFASSCSLYGTGGDAPKTESDQLDPLTAYANSKLATEEKLLASGLSYKMRSTALRFATLCGMSPRLRTDLVLNDFVYGALSSKVIHIQSDGTPWRPLLDVKDACRAIDWAMNRDGDIYQAVNVGSTNHQVYDLATQVAQAVSGAKIVMNKDAQPDKRSYQVSFDLFKNLAPDHQPQADLEQSIDEMKLGLRDVIFNGGKRLKTLEDHIAAGRLSDDLRWKF